LEAIARTTPCTKFKISTCDTSDNNVKIFKSIVWAYGPCIAVFKHLRSVITIDAGFLSGRYKGRLLMACRYDAENKVISLAFGIVNAENAENKVINIPCTVCEVREECSRRQGSPLPIIYEVPNHSTQVER
jgi:hypothetical protein